jgi:hypothetical protein
MQLATAYDTSVAARRRDRAVTDESRALAGPKAVRGCCAGVEPGSGPVTGQNLRWSWDLAPASRIWRGGQVVRSARRASAAVAHGLGVRGARGRGAWRAGPGCVARGAGAVARRCRTMASCCGMAAANRHSSRRPGGPRGSGPDLAHRPESTPRHAPVAPGPDADLSPHGDPRTGWASGAAQPAEAAQPPASCRPARNTRAPRPQPSAADAR